VSNAGSHASTFRIDPERRPECPIQTPAAPAVGVVNRCGTACSHAKLPPTMNSPRERRTATWPRASKQWGHRRRAAPMSILPQAPLGEHADPQPLMTVCAWRASFRLRRAVKQRHPTHKTLTETRAPRRIVENAGLSLEPHPVRRAIPRRRSPNPCPRGNRRGNLVGRLLAWVARPEALRRAWEAGRTPGVCHESDKRKLVRGTGNGDV
jgi:hypothetical protein